MRIWVGAQKPRMLALIGRKAGGWVCPLNIYTTPADVPPLMTRRSRFPKRRRGIES